MKPAARLQTVIEILNDFTPTKGPLSLFIKNALKQRRYAGSKDRKAITDLVYACIRFAPTYLIATHQDAWAQGQGRPLLLSLLGQKYSEDHETYIHAMFTGDAHCPTLLTTEECERLTSSNPVATTTNEPCLPWLHTHLLKSCDRTDTEALSQEAPIDIRCNSDRDAISRHLTHDNIPHIKTPYAPSGLRMLEKINLTNHPLFLQGQIDIQDESSQILASLIHSLQDKKGLSVLDLCAGGGGKSLALASLNPQAPITATDIDDKRLAGIHERIKRQGIRNITLKPYQQIINQPQRYDIVLVDAPCTGSGTLRRFPERALIINQDFTNAFIKTQREVLNHAQRLVKPGGTLVYATCSLLSLENTDQVDWFLKTYCLFSLKPLYGKVIDSLVNKNKQTDPNMTSGSLLLRPGYHETDGFFTAFLEKATSNT